MENNGERFYRFFVGNKGIYEAVDRDCPKNDPRRGHKPDGSWLPKKGLDYPGAISFWSEHGLKRYQESGLMDWHRSVVGDEVQIIIIRRPNKVLHEDEYQIIAESKGVVEISRQSLEDFLGIDNEPQEHHGK